MRTGRTACVVVAASLALLLLPAATATGAASPVCSQDATFCITAGLTATSNPAGAASSLVAAAPVTLDFSVTNSSPAHATESYWLHSATLSLASYGIASAPTLTPSAQLPDKLLLAGGTPCTSPDYTDCAGGHGTVLAIAHVTSVGDFAANGSFGIEKIVNIDPANGGAYGDYNVTFDLRLCPPSPYPCFNNSTTQEITVPQPPAGTPAPASFTITADGSTPIPGGFGTVDYALDTLSFHLDGASSQLDTGPADKIYTILAAPIDCGTATGSSSFTSHNSVTVAVPESITVTGCPTAVLASPTLSGSSASFNGSGSSTPVSGRTVAHWHWAFGDGTSAVTSVPTVSHTYAPGSSYTASLYVEDSAGARSTPVTQSVSVPATLTVADVGTGSGTVSSAPAGIDCGSTCSHAFAPGASVALTATPASGSVFSGWSGSCTGTGACTVSMSANRSVTATFTNSPPPPTKCTVPKLKGKKLAAAKTALKAAHCSLGTVKKVFSKTVRKGRVVSQKPAAGKVEPQGTKVGVTVSKGKKP